MSLAKTFGRIVVLIPSGSGSQRRMTMEHCDPSKYQEVLAQHYGIPEDLNLQLFKHSVTVFQVF